MLGSLHQPRVLACCLPSGCPSLAIATPSSDMVRVQGWKRGGVGPAPTLNCYGATAWSQWGTGPARCGIWSRLRTPLRLAFPWPLVTCLPLQAAGWSSPEGLWPGSGSPTSFQSCMTSHGPAWNLVPESHGLAAQSPYPSPWDPVL